MYVEIFVCFNFIFLKTGWPKYTWFKRGEVVLRGKLPLVICTSLGSLETLESFTTFVFLQIVNQFWTHIRKHKYYDWELDSIHCLTTLINIRVFMIWLSLTQNDHCGTVVELNTYMSLNTCCIYQTHMMQLTLKITAHCTLLDFVFVGNLMVWGTYHSV